MGEYNTAAIVSRLLSTGKVIPDYYYQDLHPFMSNSGSVSGVATPFYSLLVQLGFPDDWSFFFHENEYFDFERLKKKEELFEGLFADLLKVDCIESLLLV